MYNFGECSKSFNDDCVIPFRDIKVKYPKIWICSTLYISVATIATFYGNLTKITKSLWQRYHYHSEIHGNSQMCFDTTSQIQNKKSFKILVCISTFVFFVWEIPKANGYQSYLYVYIRVKLVFLSVVSDQKYDNDRIDKGLEIDNNKV